MRACMHTQHSGYRKHVCFFFATTKMVRTFAKRGNFGLKSFHTCMHGRCANPRRQRLAQPVMQAGFACAHLVLRRSALQPPDAGESAVLFFRSFSFSFIGHLPLGSS